MKKHTLFQRVLIAGALSLPLLLGNTAAVSAANASGCGKVKVIRIQNASDLYACLEKYGIQWKGADKGCGQNNTAAPDTQTPSQDNTVTPDPQAPPQDNTVTPDPQTPSQDDSYAGQITALVNAERRKAGLSEVTLDPSLTAAANIRAREISGYFSHTRPDGRSFYTVLADNGISYRTCGENIAYGQRDAGEVMNGWMNSSGHRANILQSSFRKIGVGYYKDARGRNNWVQIFTN